MNYPDLKLQRERIDAHSRAALRMAGILFAAGAFTGIMKESGMLGAMAKSAVDFARSGLAPHLPFALGLLSMPLSLLFDPDSFYYPRVPALSTSTQYPRTLTVMQSANGQAAHLKQSVLREAA